MTAAELAEKLERFALGPGSAWAQERTGEMADAMKQAAARLRSLEAEKEQMLKAISVAVETARPYKDESGVIEVLLHPFGGLTRIFD